jgi:alpha-N-arabinofuranosidase
MNNIIRLDPERTLGKIDRNIFGGFAEHLGRCIYGGIYDPQSSLADADGLRLDVLDNLKRLNMPVIRYPGGNFVSGYRWRDGVGPREERPTRLDLAWHVLESNQFGTNEFIQFCRRLDTEPYLVVNCGDGDAREARDWVEYCNGAQETALVKLRRQHGFDAPHRVKYWGIGNEVDGHWQIGYKTPEEYARAFTEFGKVMRWADPEIRLLAAAGCTWGPDMVERAQLLLEQAGNLVDYLSIHWYVGNPENDFARYMTLSELFEERLSAYEGIIRAMRLAQKIKRPIRIAVDEWNVGYRGGSDSTTGAEEIYNLEDALVIAMHFNAFIRHAPLVGMANIAQIVNVLAPIFTRRDGLVLQTIFYPFELYSRQCGETALDVFWTGDTFSGGSHTGIRVLDVSATLDSSAKHAALFVVNRAQQPIEVTISLTTGRFNGKAQSFVVNGPDIKAENVFDRPPQVGSQSSTFETEGAICRWTFEPHSLTGLLLPIA